MQRNMHEMDEMDIRECMECKSQLVGLTISSLWSSKFRRKDENSCRDSSKKTRTDMMSDVTDMLLEQHSSHVNDVNICMIIIIATTKHRKTLTNALLIVCFGIADVLKFELAQTLSKLLLSQGEL